jgi:imidazolonepropionase-like amidohydrolase
VKAGCTQIEHGLFVDDAAVKAMADARVFFDPNIGLILQNYLEHREQYLGSGNFTEESFAVMKTVLPNGPAAFKKALAAGIRMPLGTDAVAGGHGQNTREIIARVVDGGQRPMDAIISATSLAAESLRMGGSIGRSRSATRPI